jgi:Glycosyl transferase family 2
MNSLPLKISVCVALYNGEKYIKEQIDSILSQLGPNGEIIIVNDFSTDASLSIVSKINDNRLVIYNNYSNLGVIETFEIAIGKATGDYIFLCDQDDLWYNDKIEHFLCAFNRSRACCIVSDAHIVDKDGILVDDSFFRRFNSGAGFWKNFTKNTYLGCCMAFDARAKAWLLPFPKKIPIHDHWMGLVLDSIGGVHFLDRPLMAYRRHGENVTSLSRFGLPRVFRNRVQLLLALTRLPKLLIKRSFLGNWRHVK